MTTQAMMNTTHATCLEAAVNGDGRLVGALLEGLGRAGAQVAAGRRGSAGAAVRVAGVGTGAGRGAGLCARDHFTAGSTRLRITSAHAPRQDANARGTRARTPNPCII